MSSEVEFSVENHIAHVRLNRPARLNAITPAMDRSLRDIWARVESDPDIWVAVLTAAGEKAFCAGADVMSEAGHDGPRERIAIGGGLTGVAGPLVTLTKPLVIGVQGYVLGAGFELAMCADILVAADTARFGLPETKAGIVGESGVVHRAVRQLPHRVAMMMILTGERLNAADALGYGLVNEVVVAGQETDAALKWARLVAAASPLANRAAKIAVNQGLGRSLEQALTMRVEEIEAYADSLDCAEGVAAMKERRAPAWSGR